MATPHGPSPVVSRALAAAQGAPGVLTPEHLARLLDLARALSGASDHAEIAVIAAERTRTVAGASATQISAFAEDGREAPPRRSSPSSRTTR